jgi:hypothetical protein
LDAGSLPAADKSSGDLLGLVESAGATLAFEQRNRHYQGALRQRKALQSLIQQGCEPGRNRLNALVLEQMDKIAKRAFIGSIRNRLPERRGRPAAQAAYRAGAGLNILAEKFFPTNATDDPVDGNDLITAGFTNWQRGDSGKRSVADPAVRGEQDGKQALCRNF